MRAEVAVCLLAEVAYEHDEDFRGHLPLLFHTMLLLMDSTDNLVFRHAQQVVTHLLYSLSVRHLELHRAAGEPCPLLPVTPVKFWCGIHLFYFFLQKQTCLNTTLLAASSSH